MANMVVMQANFGLDVVHNFFHKYRHRPLQKIMRRSVSLFLTDPFPEARHSCGDIIMTSACWNSDGGRHL